MGLMNKLKTSGGLIAFRRKILGFKFKKLAALVVEFIAHAVLIEPGTGFFHGVAGFDAEKVQRFA